MTPEAILAIPLNQPERLFTRDRYISQRRELIKEWHPDRNHHPQATDVFDHIQKLYEETVRRLEAGEWRNHGMVELKSTTGSTYLIRYQVEHQIDLGTMYVGNRAVTFVCSKEYADLVEHARKMIGALKYPSPKVQEQIGRFMPKVAATLNTPDKTGFVVSKTEDVILLRDVYNYYKGKIDSKHVAWIISSLWNLSCYMQVTELVHPDISMDTVFISPPHHSACLLGGWWFATNTEVQLRALPQRSLGLLPKSVLESKRANGRMTCELIKALGRELLGDIGGSSLRANKDIPAPLVSWLLLPAHPEALKNYHEWSTEVLPASFGARRFVEMKLSASDLYT